MLSRTVQTPDATVREDTVKASPDSTEAPEACAQDRVRLSTIAFWSLLAFGFALRVIFVFSTNFRMDSDHAIVYLMARQVADGQFPVFFWGQYYGGTFLSLLAGVVMLVTGPSLTVLAITTALLWAGAAIVFRYFVARSIGPRAGNIAGVLFWFPGGVIISSSVADPGFYGATFLFAIGTALAVVATRGRRGVLGWIVVGFLAGLSLWTSPMAIALATPAVVFALWSDRRWRMWLIGVVAGLVGASPWIVQTMLSSFNSVKPIGDGTSLYLDSFASLFTTMFPAAFPGSTYELMRFAVSMAVVFTLGLLVYRAVTRRNAGAIIMATGTLLVIFVLVLGSGVRLGAESVRYAVFLIPGLSMSIAWVASRWRITAIIVPVLAVIITTAMVFDRQEGFRLSAPTPFSAEIEAVDRFFDDQGVDAAYGSYWIAYAVSAESDEDPTVASFLPRRYEPYELDATGVSPMGVVVFAGDYNDEVLAARAPVEPRGRTLIGPYAVYIFDTWFDPYTLKLGLN